MPAAIPGVSLKINTAKGQNSSTPEWANTIIDILDDLGGESNVFGTAATRNTGIVEGTVPLIGSGDEIQASILPEATTTTKGALSAEDKRKLDTTPTEQEVYDLAKLILTGGANITVTPSDTTRRLAVASTVSSEQVQDIVGGMVSGNTETGITVTYDDSTGKLNFNVPSGFRSTENIQDIVGAMVTGNTETGITVTYNDSTGKLNFTVP